MPIKSNIIDIILLFASLNIIIVVSLVSASKERAGLHFFLSGRSEGWTAIASSIFTANLVGYHFFLFFNIIDALHIAVLEMLTLTVILLISWLVTPLYFKNKYATFPELIGRRFNPFCRSYVSYVTLTSNVLIRISLILLFASMLLNGVLGLDIISSLVFIVATAGIYSIIGGANAGFRMDTFFTAIILLGLLILVSFNLFSPTEMSSLQWFEWPEFDMETSGLFKSKTSLAGVAFAIPIFTFWSFAADQFIVQKIFAAKNLGAARKGVLAAGVLTMILFAVSFLPGFKSIIKSTHNYEVHKSIAGLLDQLHSLPVGSWYIVVVIVAAALISSLAGAFNSFAGVYAFDIYRPRNPNASENALVLVGRLATVVIVCFSIVLIPFICFLTTDFIGYMLLFQAVLVPPIISLFFLGSIFKRITPYAATITLSISLILGLLRLLGQLFIDAGVLYSKLVDKLVAIDAFNFAFILFTLTSLMLLAFSYVPERFYFLVDGKRMKSM